MTIDRFWGSKIAEWFVRNLDLSSFLSSLLGGQNKVLTLFFFGHFLLLKVLNESLRDVPQLFPFLLQAIQLSVFCLSPAALAVKVPGLESTVTILWREQAKQNVLAPPGGWPHEHGYEREHGQHLEGGDVGVAEEVRVAKARGGHKRAHISWKSVETVGERNRILNKVTDSRSSAKMQNLIYDWITSPALGINPELLGFWTCPKAI